MSQSEGFTTADSGITEVNKTKEHSQCKSLFKSLNMSLSNLRTRNR